MKKSIFIALVLALAITSCSDKKSTESVESITETSTVVEEPKTAEPTVALTPEEEGQKLVEGADCLGCHKIDAKLVGPSYQEVANKYTEADIDHLAQKIIDGGQGVWGNVPMAAHNGMSKENAQKMVKYILSLKK